MLCILRCTKYVVVEGLIAPIAASATILYSVRVLLINNVCASTSYGAYDEIMGQADASSKPESRKGK